MENTFASIENIAIAYGFKKVCEGTYTFKGYLLSMQINSLTNIELDIATSAYSLEDVMFAQGERKVKSFE
jgi:hypothetical protein